MVPCNVFQFKYLPTNLSVFVSVCKVIVTKKIVKSSENDSKAAKGFGIFHLGTFVLACIHILAIFKKKKYLKTWIKNHQSSEIVVDK